MIRHFVQIVKTKERGVAGQRDTNMFVCYLFLVVGDRSINFKKKTTKESFVYTLLEHQGQLTDNDGGRKSECLRSHDSTTNTTR